MMRLPLAPQNRLNSKDCPFYCVDKDGQWGCVVKQISSQKKWNSILENLSEEFHKEYEEDCGGQFDKCCFANDIWSYDPDEITETTETTLSSTEEDENMINVKLSINKIANPFAVISDVLIYPTNNLLEIDDILMNVLSRRNIQQDCDKIVNNETIQMGEVYITDNGGNHQNGVKSKQIYHAVVAGESRLVNDIDIKKSMQKALLLADNNGAETITILPADAGEHDIEATAYAQLGAIKTVLDKTGISNIRHIFIVMNDELSYEAFIKVFSSIYSD